jgi:hypothetical protein
MLCKFLSNHALMGICDENACGLGYAIFTTSINAIMSKFSLRGAGGCSSGTFASITTFHMVQTSVRKGFQVARGLRLCASEM